MPHDATTLPDGTPNGTEAIVEATDVAKTYRSGGAAIQALRGVSLRVARGEMVSIMGPSGCGKTTLLNCLSGLDDVDSGVIRIEGEEIQRLSDNARTDYRARRMGFVFQFYNLLPVLSAVENIELPLLVSGVSARQARERARRALAELHLADWESHRPAQLSGGQRQRVTIARALVNDPAIVWADEPTGDLDSVNAGEILDVIQRLNDENGQSFVLVTHDPNIAARCHRTILMRDGRIEGEERHRPFTPRRIPGRELPGAAGGSAP